MLNQLALKLSSISPRLKPSAMLHEYTYVDTQLFNNEPVDAPSTYFDDCGVLEQSFECQL
ncbi:MAG: hypothetical protein ACYS17_03545 [Planctomycetota bacterium]